jgi:hypothetical protein
LRCVVECLDGLFSLGFEIIGHTRPNCCIRRVVMGVRWAVGQSGKGKRIGKIASDEDRSGER